MVGDTHQHYLFSMSAGSIAIDDFGPDRIDPSVRDWKEPIDLFDGCGPPKRFVRLSELDSLGFRPEWDAFVRALPVGCELWLADDRKIPPLPAVESYAEETLRRYIHLLLEANIPCRFGRWKAS